MADTGFKFCTQCGTKLSADARFCTNCGAPCAPGGDAAPVAAQPAGQEAFAKGQQYFLGEGVAQDFDAAQKAFAEAAAAGHIEAPVWVEMCKHYREIMQLSQRADAIRNGMTPQQAAEKYPSVMGTAKPAAPAGQQQHPQQQHPQGNRPGTSQHRGGMGTLGKVAAGAAVGAVVSSMFGGHGHVAGTDMDQDQDDANDYQQNDDTAADEVNTDADQNDQNYDDSGNDTSYDDNSSDDDISSDDAGSDDTGSDDGGGGGFFDNVFGGDDGGGFFGDDD